MKNSIYWCWLSVFFITCRPQAEKDINADLAIKNVSVFNSKSKTVSPGKTILIKGDSILNIMDVSEKVDAKKIIEGNGRLAVPGFIDTHIHLTQIFGDGNETGPELIEDTHSYRSILSEQYLAHGTTTIVDMGMPERWMEVALNWQKNTSPEYPNLYITGGALISDEERETNINHVEVLDPDHAREKIRAYKKTGVKHLKLYSRLREPEMKSVLEEAKAQNMGTYGHIQFQLTFQEAMEMGVRNFEHFFTLVSSVWNYDDYWAPFVKEYNLKRSGTIDEFAADMVLMLDYVNRTPKLALQLDNLLNRMAQNGTTISTTLNVMASAAGRSQFFTSFQNFPIREKPYLPNDTPQNRKRLFNAFDTTMKLLKAAHEKGIKIRIGTDCKNGGKALLSELMLLAEAGFKIEDILQIATLHGAESMHIEKSYGSLEKGKKADIVLFEKNPFDDYRNFMSTKTIVKSGKVYSSRSSMSQSMVHIINEIGVNEGIDWFQGFDAPPLNEIELNEIGYHFLLSGKTKEAIAIFKLSFKVFPKTNDKYNGLNEENLFLQGSYLLHLEQIVSARHMFEFITEMYPNSARAYYGLGKVYQKKGQIENAVIHYKKSLQFDPEYIMPKEGLKQLGF